MTAEAGERRWQGQPGRLEVWYATLTDPATGTGAWVHCETVAPADGGEAFGHGWAALFPVDGPPRWARFGPGPVRLTNGAWFDAAGCTVGPDRLVGSAGDSAGDRLTWDLAYADDSPTLYTFPRWAWDGESLPGGQVVPAPQARFAGSIGGLSVEDAPGGVAHIYSHGNAQRWGWLHAELGDGAVLEIVTAVSRAPGLRRLPPLAFVQLRRPDHDDWPGDSMAAASLFRTRLALPTWTVRGVVGLHRLRVEVTIPEERSIAVDYADPDGAPAVCVNSETADAHIILDRLSGRRWVSEGEWDLRATAHAEVGRRPVRSRP
jgi:hypothetical protein